MGAELTTNRLQQTSVGITGIAALQVLIADDSVTIRAKLEQVISASDGCHVVGLAANVDDARRLMKQKWPDVMTLDLTMPGIDGFQFLRDMQGQHHPPIVVVSSSSHAGAEAVELGAAACFDKAKLLTEASQFLRLLRKAARPKPISLRRRAIGGQSSTATQVIGE